MVYISKPKNFKPIINSVGCYIRAGGEFLLVRRNVNKIEGNKWGLPGGKIEKLETRDSAVIREVNEEVDIKLKRSQLKYVTKVYVKYPTFHYIFYIYEAKLKRKPVVNLKADEHNDYKWVKYKDSLDLNLVSGNRTCLRLIHKLTSSCV